MDGVILNPVLHNMVVDFDVFYVFVEDGVRSNLHSASVITVENNGLLERDVKVLKQKLYPNGFTSGVCQGHVFRF